MTYRSDVDALAARKQALETEIAERTRQRDETARMLDDATRRVRLLDQLRVAAPCSESWDLMEGNDQVRHCGKCDQQVFNLSAMTRDEAETLVRDKQGNLCARYFQRKDGTIITQNCPVGVRRQRRGLAIAAGALASVVGGSAVLASAPVEVPRAVMENHTEVMGTAVMGGMGPPPLVEGQLPWACNDLQEQLKQLAACDRNTARALDPIPDWAALEAAAPTMKMERLERLNARCSDRAEAVYTATNKLCTADQGSIASED
jgi:hypothetical protein